MESGVTIRLSVPDAVRRLRHRFDPNAALGIPAHVTILYPFLPPEDLDDSVRTALARIATEHEPFDVALVEVGRWPTVVYLRPEPADRFLSLTRSVFARWPSCPPYAGIHTELVPHLTLAETDDGAVLEETATAAGKLHLPIRSRASSIEVLTDSDDGTWRLRWRLPLGERTRPT